jgi:exonuclease III
MILIALSADIESNPGFLVLDDMGKTCGLKIAHLNIRSLRHKVHSLQHEGMNNKTVDILTSETSWLDNTVEDSEIAVPGFHCVRKDRTGVKEGYGGVAIYVHEGLPYRVREDVNSVDNECLCIEIIRTKCKPTIICCAY